MSEIGLSFAKAFGGGPLGAGRKRGMRIVAVLAALVGVELAVPAAAGAASGLDVYVGYMDTHTVATSSQQPDPWPYTDPSRYIGTPCPNYGGTMACWDASALRLVNTTSSDVTGVHVVVTMGTHKYDLWGNFTVKANSDLVLTETGSSPNSENFDGSDFSPNAYNGGLEAPCTNSGAYPVVTVTIGGTTTTYNDTGQVLNAGGVDDGHCVDGVFVPGRIDESHPWVMIGTAPADGGGSTQATAPSAPTGLKATAGDGSVSLTWTRPSDGVSAITGYKILRGTSSGGESSTAVATQSSTSFTDRNLTNGTAYYYKVVAENGIGSSPPSSEVSATPQSSSTSPPPPPPPGPPPGPPPSSASVPAAPSGLTATGTDGAVRLSWTAPASDRGSPVTGYRVYRGSTSGGESATAIGTPTSAGFTDTGVINGSRYFYTVVAVNAVGPSPQSEEVSAVPQDSATPPARRSGVCAGMGGCRLMVRADIDGDGRRDAVAMARRRTVLVLRVRTGLDHVVQTRRHLGDWAGSAWAGVARLDGRRGKEVVLGRRIAGDARFYQAVTWRRGRLVLLDAPGRARWWRVESSASMRAGWIHPHSSPDGTVRRRVATPAGANGAYRGDLDTYRWTQAGWRLTSSVTIRSMSEVRALRWGRFQVHGLPRS